MYDDTHNGENPHEIDARVWPSVDNARPPEEGGPVARKGFNYQDEVAVSFLLDMLEDQSIIKIHCETHDDITVVSLIEGSDQKRAEYVQVKATSPDQLWTVAHLCQRKNSKQGTSVFERSIAHDCHEEQSRFRILTLRQVSADLKILTNPVASFGREPDCEGLQNLKKKIDERCPSLLSPKGNDCKFWLDNCFWDERFSEEAICNQNQLRVFQISSAKQSTLLQEQIDSILNDMRLWVKAAGAASWVPDRGKKVITRERLLRWWLQRVDELTATGGVSGEKLTQKMQVAHLPIDVISLAVDMRRRYTRVLRTPRYAGDEGTEELLGRVRAEAISLRSRYTAGQLDVSPATFHSMCLDRMDVINGERPNNEPDQSLFLKGCLYDIADRCMLRFDKVTP